MEQSEQKHTYITRLLDKALPELIAQVRAAGCPDDRLACAVLDSFFKSYGYFHAISGDCEHESLVMYFPDKRVHIEEFVNSGYELMAFNAFSEFFEDMEKRLKKKWLKRLRKIRISMDFSVTFKFEPYVSIINPDDIEHWNIFKERLFYVDYWEKSPDNYLGKKHKVILNAYYFNKLRAYQEYFRLKDIQKTII